MPTPTVPLLPMTADERYEIAKAGSKARAHIAMARVYLAVWNKKKEDK